MPVYTYRCDNCGIQFDRRQRFSDPLMNTCPECDKKTLRKVYLPVGVVFKGSGFYSTDNRASNGRSRNANKTKEEETKKEKNTETTTSKESD